MKFNTAAQRTLRLLRVLLYAYMAGACCMNVNGVPSTYDMVKLYGHASSSYDEYNSSLCRPSLFCVQLHWHISGNLLHSICLLSQDVFLSHTKRPRLATPALMELPCHQGSKAWVCMKGDRSLLCRPCPSLSQANTSLKLLAQTVEESTARRLQCALGPISLLPLQSVPETPLLSLLVVKELTQPLATLKAQLAEEADLLSSFNHSVHPPQSSQQVRRLVCFNVS